MKYISSIITTVLLCIVFMFFPHNRIIEEVSTSLNPIPTDETEVLESVPVKPLEETILEQMSIEEKVGQLFMFGFDGTTLSPENKKFLQERNIGGVLLLRKNITSEKQLKELIKDIHSTNDIPLFISIDQEGGVVSRIRWNETLTKSQSEINTSEQAYSLAKSRGNILKNLGINMNLAPVVEYITDVNSFIYNRVYRGTKDDVLLKSISSVNGYTDSGIISVLKHYPGHSNSSPDSHFNLPIVNIKDENWDEYIEPFSKIFEQTTVDALMVGHIKFPNIDSKPSTISKEILTERLLNDLSYKGIVISDDMEMDALDDIDSYTNIAKQALLAGNDILIYSKYSNKYPTIQKDVYEFILNEVKSGEMDIDSKVQNILRIKIKYDILNTELEQ